MQWLIDIIVDLVGGVSGYFDRGDPGTPDFVLGDLVADSTWRDMDLSGIVPADTRGVLLRVTFNAGAIDKQIAFRNKSHTHYPNVAYCLLSVAGVIQAYDKTVSVDSNRVIQYRLSVPPITTVQITVAAWWLRQT